MAGSNQVVYMAWIFGYLCIKAVAFSPAVFQSTYPSVRTVSFGLNSLMQSFTAWSMTLSTKYSSW